MAITFDALASGNTGSFALTLASHAGKHAILIVFVSVLSANGTEAQTFVSSVKWNTTESLTFIGRNSGAYGEANENIEMWALVDPTAGAHNIDTVLVGTPSGRPSAQMTTGVGYLVDGVPSVSGGAGTHSTTTSTVTVVSTTGSLVVVGANLTETNASSAPTATVGQNSRAITLFADDGVPDTKGWLPVSDKAGAVAVIVSWAMSGQKHASIYGASVDEAAVPVTVAARRTMKQTGTRMGSRAS